MVCINIIMMCHILTILLDEGCSSPTFFKLSHAGVVVSDSPTNQSLVNVSSHSPPSLTTPLLGNSVKLIVYSIPSSRPPRFLQLAYDTNQLINPVAFNFVVSTIIGQVEEQLNLRGNGPMVRNPYKYYIPGCYSSTVTGEPGMTGGRMTYAMLNEVMLALQTVMEEQDRFYDVFYDLTDANSHVIGQGHLLARETLRRYQYPRHLE